MAIQDPKKELIFNTDINTIGSIRDYRMIHKLLSLFAQNKMSEIEAIFVHMNEFDFRTEKTRKRFLLAAQSAFIVFKNERHEAFIKALFQKNLPDDLKQRILFWQLNFSNPLFQKITEDVFIKTYFSGRISLPKEEIEAYLKELIHEHEELKSKWSDITIEHLASKYLTILKKLDLMDGSAVKQFKQIHISREALIVYLYLYMSANPDNSNILSNYDYLMTFTTKESLIEKIKQLSLKGLIEMSYNGINLNIAPTKIGEDYLNDLYR
jgi:hypothetical protein